jgi:putative flippase GtrA
MRMRMTPAAVVARVQDDLGAKFVKYSAVSVISVIVSQVTLVACHDFFGWEPGWSNVTAVSVSSIPAYLLNRAWVWGKSGRSHFLKEVVPFWGMAIIGLALSTWLVVLAARWWPGSTVAVSAANLAGFGILWFAKFAVLEEVLFKVGIHDDSILDEEPAAA